MADSILFWNAVALEAVRVSHSDPAKREQNGPTLSSRALAIVHLAMYDAYAGVPNPAGGLPPYRVEPTLPAPGASQRNAVAGAAFTALSSLYRRQVDFFTAQLACFEQSDPSFAFGAAVANALLAERANDPDARDAGYIVSPARGRHRVDPDNPEQGFDSPFYGAQSRGFAITRRHGLDAPPFDDGCDPVYIEALRHVRAKGIRPDLMATLPSSLFNRRRTAEETLKGIFWAYDGAVRLGTPPRFYNLIVRSVAMRMGNTESDNARLFAFVNAALGDAGILAWEQKYCHDFWRPVVGTREHDPSFGPAAPHPRPPCMQETRDNVEGGAPMPPPFLDDDADPFWLPLGAPSTNTMMKNATPNFPAYPSGHATFGAAAFHITRLFYNIPCGDRQPDNLLDDLTFVSEELNGENRDNQGTVRPRHVRRFPDGLWGMLLENARERVYLGVHWIFDAFLPIPETQPAQPNFERNIGGLILGLNIAEDIFQAGDGQAPRMTPCGTASPPIGTPLPNRAGMPTVPAQPFGTCQPQVPGTSGAGERVTQPYPKGLSPR